MSSHPKTTRPTDADLKGNPMIGGSAGTTASGTTPDELDAAQGETTIEGDVPNDTNAFGGIDKADARGGPQQQVSTPPHRPRGN
jgi:hypothetical protein